MENRRYNDDIEGRVQVLEAVLPRIEKQGHDNAAILFNKLDNIKDNMVTKEELKQQLKPLQNDYQTVLDAGNDNKKKIFWMQCQIIALSGIFILYLFIGAKETLGIVGSVASKVVP